MFINKLHVSEHSQISFKKGLNIILGVNRPSIENEDERVSDTNGVGKSTIISLIKFLLCGDTGKYLESSFFSSQNILPKLEIEVQGLFYVIFAPLKEKIRSKVYVVYEGKLDDLINDLSDFSLDEMETHRDVESFFKDKESFTTYSKDEIKNLICRWENIDYSDANLKLSSLLDYISRDEKLGFGDPVARLARTMWVQNRAVQYLFGLPYTIEEKSNIHKEEIAKLEHELTIREKFLTERNISSSDAIESSRITINDTLADIRVDLEKVDLTTTNEKIRKDYQSKKEQLVRINEELNYRETQLQNQRSNIEELSEKQSSIKKLLEVEDFFKDVIEVFPTVLKENIEKYNDFFTTLSQDRKDYHKDLIKQISDKIKNLNKEKSEIEKELASISGYLTNTEVIKDLSRLTAREEKLKLKLEELKEAEKYLIEVDVYKEQIQNSKSKWEKLIQEGKIYDRSIDFKKFKFSMIKLFLGMVKDSYHTNEGALEFIYNDNINTSTAGRTEVICSLPSDTSHGRTNAKICLFDFTWFLRKRADGEFDPKFLIHDGPYSKISTNVKYNMLKMIHDRTLNENKQYIITANDNEIPHLQEFESSVRLRLDGTDISKKFFGIQYE